MDNNKTTILNKVFSLERDLQSLKLNLGSVASKGEKKLPAYYSDRAILNEIRKIRRKFWNEKYSKAA